jgi:hypothetical protein
MLKSLIAVVFVALGVVAGFHVCQAAEFPEVEKLPVVADLPDPLKMFDGTPVKTRQEWEARRKPELKALFQHYMYGYLPAAPKIRSKVNSTHNDLFGGKATMKQVTISFGPPGCPDIDLILFTPNKKTDRPAPVVLGLNFTGNHTLLDDPRITLNKNWMRNGPGVENNHATEASRGTSERWAVEQILDRGYALATFYYGDVMPDKPDFEAGVHPYFRKSGQTEQGPLDWAAIAAWAWGLHRGVDYLVTDDSVDPKRIVVFGHSRNGKAALLAAALDDRIAVAIPHQAGCGGTAPSRQHNPKAETVKVINKSFPHWFNANFKKFDDQVEKLPFDQHCLVALCAPRAVILTNGDEDQWANPPGQFEVVRGAEPVYRLYGIEGIDAAVQEPPTGKIVGTKLAYYVSHEKHTVTPAYWNVFLDFADQALGNK